MPGESVAAYVNYTLSFVIFILVCILLFIIMFAISTGIRKKVLNRNRQIPYNEIDAANGGKSFIGQPYYDPFIKRNSALLGMVFITVLIFIILLLASLYFSINIGSGMILVVISCALAGFMAVLIYIFRSGIIKK